MQRGFLILFLSLFVLNTWGIDQNQLSFKNIDNKKGLSQNGVLSVFQDRDGYMWFGTHYGLNRFDGFSLKTYYRGNTKNDLSGNTVLSIVQDSVGNMWFSTIEGLTVYNPQTGQFYNLTKYAHQDSPFGHSILSLNRIDNRILFTSSEGIWQISPLAELVNEELAKELGSGINLSRLKSTIELESIQIFQKDKNDNYWAIANNQIVSLKIIGTSVLVIDEIEIMQNALLTTFYIDTYSNIWVGTSMHGLFRLIESKGKYSSELVYPAVNDQVSFSRITDIAQDAQGNVWVASRGDGVIVIGKENLENYSFCPVKIKESIFESQKVKSFYVSRDKTLWIGSLGKGVYCCNRSGFKFKNHRIDPHQKYSSARNTRSVSKDRFGRLWFGTLFEGLHIYNPEKTRVEQIILPGKSVFSLLELDNKHYLAGCSDGLYHVGYTRNEAYVTDLFRVAGGSGTVFTISRKNDKFWVGTDKQILSFKLTEKHKFVQGKSINNSMLTESAVRNSIRCIRYDSIRNCLWIGGEMSGLLRADLDEDDNIKSFTPLSQLVENSNFLGHYVSDIYYDKENCWVATRNGLFHLSLRENGKVISCDNYTMKNGLPSNMIQSIEADESGYLWLGTNKGLLRFNRKTEALTVYQIDDGIQDLEFSEHASCSDEDENLYFGGINGVTQFYPEKNQPDEIGEPVFIESVQVNGKILTRNFLHASSETIKLRYNENNLKFTFISFNYQAPSKLKYTYMLEGYDHEWRNTSATKRMAEYVGLPGGDYIFKVRVYNEDGIFQSDNEGYMFSVQPPLYLRIWFIGICVFLLIFMALLIVRITQKRLRIKHQEELDKQYRDQIEEINRAKLQFFINISHEIRTPLTLIVCSVEKLFSSLKTHDYQEKEFVTISRNVNRILHLTDELLEIRKIETGNYRLSVRKSNIVSFAEEIMQAFSSMTEKLNIKMSFDSFTHDAEIFFDANALEKVLYNLISNAIKYTDEGGSIALNVEPGEDKNYLEISVKDNGIGIRKDFLPNIFDRFYHQTSGQKTKDKGFGIGLSLSKNLIELHKGFIKVASEEGVGSVFTVGLPIQDGVYSEGEKADHAYRNTDLSVGIERLDKQRSNEEPVLLSAECKKINHKKPSVLYVDDNIELLSNVQEYLTTNYNVLTANNGRDGIEMAKKYLPDIVLSDIVMPEPDGFELCVKLKNNIITAHIPVILLTARGDSDSHIKGMEIGADLFIPKPFNLKLLDLKIKNLIESRWKLQKLFTTNQYVTPRELTTNHKDEKFLEKLLAYVEEKIAEPDLNINHIADTMGMSRSTFFRKIKAITGTTGKEFIDSVKLKKASNLLLESDMNISEIAYSLGHSSPQYFSKWFKSHYQMSPTDYIAKNKDA